MGSADRRESEAGGDRPSYDELYAAYCAMRDTVNGWRWSRSHGWLPVCRQHMEPSRVYGRHLKSVVERSV